MTGQYPGEVRLDANGKPVTLLQLKAEYGNEKKLRRSVGSALRFVGFLALQLFLQIRRRLRPWQPIAIRGRSLYPWPPIAARESFPLYFLCGGNRYHDILCVGVW